MSAGLVSIHSGRFSGKKNGLLILEIFFSSEKGKTLYQRADSGFSICLISGRSDNISMMIGGLWLGSPIGFELHLHYLNNCINALTRTRSQIQRKKFNDVRR